MGSAEDSVIEGFSFFLGVTTGAVPVLLLAAAFHDEEEGGPMHRVWEWVRDPHGSPRE